MWGGGEEAGAGLLGFSSSGDSPLQGLDFNYRQVVVFYMTYFPDGFPRVSLMP